MENLGLVERKMLFESIKKSCSRQRKYFGTAYHLRRGKSFARVQALVAALIDDQRRNESDQKTPANHAWAGVFLLSTITLGFDILSRVCVHLAGCHQD